MNIDHVSTLTEVTTTGDLRRLVAEQMLALSRKQIPISQLEAIGKGLAYISESLAVEVKAVKLRREMLALGGSGLNATDDVPNLGMMRIDSVEKE